MKQIVKTVASRVLRLLERRGALDPDSLDPLCGDSPVLAGISSASVRGLVATGDRAGRVVRRVLTDPAEPVRTGSLCFASRGFSLHAATRIEAGDSAGLSEKPGPREFRRLRRGHPSRRSPGGRSRPHLALQSAAAKDE